MGRKTKQWIGRLTIEGRRTSSATPSPPQSRTSHVIVEYSDGCAKGRTEKLMPAAERSEAKGLLPEPERITVQQVGETNPSGSLRALTHVRPTPLASGIDSFIQHLI